MEEKKPSLLKKILTVLISIAIAGLFLWLALKGLDFDKIKVSLQKANYIWVAFAGFFGISAYWFRAIRWNLLLEPMGHKISNSNSLWSLSFGYLMNLTIPRSGEVARSTALYGVEKVPVDKSFGTIILERVVDLVCMGIFALLTLIFKYDALLAFYKAATQQKAVEKKELNWFEQSLLKIGITDLEQFYFFSKIAIGIIVIAVLSYLFIYKKDKLIDFAKGVFEGLKSILTLKQKGKFILYTAGIWICYFFASYLVCFALPETSNFSPADGCFILVVGTLGMIIPASGGIGAFNLAMKFGFTALFISMGKDAVEGGELGLAYSFITLPLQIIIMLVMGLISIPMLAKNRKL
ncbi:lysylphosphatidylglycerol synthase transmembrane domain-containing protein [Chryseobacterium sp. FH1]|uniref:lysylphosphatidylglycerol synthase transmembrane domain-containing protein n=1 Tax=Chryseobacterium sp. FH1 TaxID=1233951 RepID=UPI0004E2A9C2|nr:lysylphosphatidylglycerol synthase transmembrane domain-containing protein [Chryseobacterium sp. FH1]KFC18836.1 membrane protein [Chryseobacterium sp. FH1]